MMAYKDLQKKRIWETKIHEWLGGGLNGSMWCRENNELQHQLYYWKKETSHSLKKNVKDTVTATLPCKSLYLYSQPTDMRKGFEGLASIVIDKYEEEFTSGTHFGFINNRYNRIKVLYRVGNGLVIWNKRLERGTITIEATTFSLNNKGQFIRII